VLLLLRIFSRPYLTVAVALHCSIRLSSVCNLRIVSVIIFYYAIINEDPHRLSLVTMSLSLQQFGGSLECKVFACNHYPRAPNYRTVS